MVRHDTGYDTTVKRRTFLSGVVGLPAIAAGADKFDVAAFDRARVLCNARKYLSDRAVTVTSAQSQWSAGGLHDFFSEGDYGSLD